MWIASTIDVYHELFFEQCYCTHISSVKKQDRLKH